MEIVGYFRTSLIEWPDKISSVIFVPGCNFRCPFCYNRNLVLNPKKLSRIPEKDILIDLEKRKKWVDGIVVTGGEPSLRPDLRKFLKKVKKIGLLTRIYTNGSNSRLLENLLKKRLLDAITMDIKGPLDERYSQAAGVSLNLEEILKSIRLILESGIEFQFATTVVPRLHKKKDLIDLARGLAELVQIAGRNEQEVFWLWRQFQPKNTCINPRFSKMKPYSRREIKSFVREVKKICPKVKLEIS